MADRLWQEYVARPVVSPLLFTARELKELPTTKVTIPDHEPEDFLMAMFDFPLRVCAGWRR
jgi:E3 ubiquitin-protein ligase UBR1